MITTGKFVGCALISTIGPGNNPLTILISNAEMEVKIKPLYVDEGTRDGQGGDAIET